MITDVLAASERLTASDPTIGRIPVRNVWLLMLYASELYRHLGHRRQGCEDEPDRLPDLVAEILVHEVEQRLRWRLSQGFQSRTAHLSRLRGRLDVLDTYCHNLLAKGRVACRFEELSQDTPRNRYVKAAMLELAHRVTRKELAHRCRALVRILTDFGVGNAHGRTVASSFPPSVRVEMRDQAMVAAARLAFELALPNDEMGDNWLQQAYRDETMMRSLFEKAVGGFYSVVLGDQGWKVSCGRPLWWKTCDATEGIENLLPRMQTDIILESPGKTRMIVIDTKFTYILTKGFYRLESFKSEHIYQLYSYLRSQENGGDSLVDTAEGLLLYPSVNSHVDESVTLQRHRVRLATVDLAGSAVKMRQDLLAAVSLS